MENILINDEEKDGIYTLEIKGRECLHYKLNFPRENVFKNPKFKNWLNKIIKEKGKIDNLRYCEKCNIFAYKEDSMFAFVCTSNCNYLTHFCFFCRKIYQDERYCCYKRGLKESFKSYLFNWEYKCDDWYEYIRFIPYLFNVIFIGSIFYGLFLDIRYKNENYSYESKINRNNHYLE